MAANSEIEQRLDEVVAALRVLATTTVDDDAATIAERTEAVRAAGEAFDDAIAAVSISYSTVFAWSDVEPAWDEEQDSEEVDPVTRLSVDVRADFVVDDEPAFVSAAKQMLAGRGARPLERDSALSALDALVDAFGLDELTSGAAMEGLHYVGGEWGVSDDDVDLEDEPDE